MRELKFLPLNDEYLEGPEKGTERAFEETMIAGWEKRHYIPDAYKAYGDLTEPEKYMLRMYERGPKFHFLSDLDKTVYIAPNEEFVLLVSRKNDAVSIQFILDEDSQNRPDTFDQWKRAVAIRADLDNIKDAHAPIFAVSELPDMNSLGFNAYYLVHNKEHATLYYIDIYERTVLEIEPKADVSAAFDANIALLLEAVLGGDTGMVFEMLSKINLQIKNIVPNTQWNPSRSSSPLENPEGGYNTVIEFKSWPDDHSASEYLTTDKFDFTKLKASLDVFKRHCNLPDAVVEDVHRVLDAHQGRFLSHKEWLANRLNEDPEGMLLQIKGIITRHHVVTSVVGHFFSTIRWYAEHGCVDTAILLQKGMPKSDYSIEGYIEIARYIQDLMMRNENIGADKRAYLERLSEMSLELADASKKEEDLTFALRIISQLCGGDGYSPDLNVDRSKLYLSLLVKYASQVGKFKEDNKVLKEEVVKLKEEKKTPNEPVGSMALVAAPRANETINPALTGRPRRNSSVF